MCFPGHPLRVTQLCVCRAEETITGVHVLELGSVAKCPVWGRKKAEWGRERSGGWPSKRRWPEPTFEHQLVRGSLCILSHLVLPVILCCRSYLASFTEQAQRS